MHLRAKLTWIAVTVLALGAEGSALAQSAPAHAASASDRSPARAQQESVPVGPQLEAARASLKSDTAAPFDWNSLANRQATAGTAGPSGLALPSGAGAPIPSNPESGRHPQVLHLDATGAPSTTAGSATRVVPLGDPQQAATPTSAPTQLAESVIRGQINPAARSCYQNDPDSKSRKPGRLVILIKLAPAGEVEAVSVSSNVGLSPSLDSCVATAARAARFAPPGANGTTVAAAFTFPLHEDKAAPAAASPKGAPVASAAGHAAPDQVAH